MAGAGRCLVRSAISRSDPGPAIIWTISDHPPALSPSVVYTLTPMNLEP
jgi:hypothetical protein